MYRNNKETMEIFKQERESRLRVFAHGGGKMSMRFNQGKCCERKGKNGASAARHVTEKHAKIEEK